MFAAHGFALFVLRLALLLSSQPIHSHLQFNNKQFNLTLLHKLRQSLQHSVLGELLSGKEESLGGQVANSTVEHLQSEQLLNQVVILQKRCFKSVGHVVFIHQSTLTTEVLVNN